jgi:Mrp family chromosome partitioning ATPase/capsular polysaccharide biosynthesis protein
MLHTEPLVLLPHDLHGEPLGANDRESLDTDAIIRFIQKSWRLCLIWISAGLCAGIAFAILSPAYYTAYVTILFEDHALRSLAASISGADAAAAAYLDSQVQILQSDEVVGRVVAQHRLTENQEFGAKDGLRTRIASFLGFGRVTMDPEARHVTILRMERALSVRRIGTSDTVEIGFTSKDRLRSAAIANAIVQSYTDGRREMKRQASEESLTYLRERLAELRDKAFAIEPTQDPRPATSQSAEQARARFRELQSNTETYRAMYSGLLQRAYTDTDSQLSSLSVRVITPAEPPLGSSWPRMIFVFGIVAAAGIAGIGHALLREATDRTLRTVEDVRRSTGLHRIAGVPEIERQAWITGELHSGGLQPAYVNTSADFLHAMVRLAVRLQQGQDRRFLIGVAAPTGGVGASSVAAHLANTLAEGGQKTLLVDANWRKPSMPLAMLNSNLSRTHAQGLAAIHLEPEGLGILVLRATAPISELTASLSIATTLLHLQSEYDCVVIDFHSAEQTADLEASMAVINEVIVVVEAGRTTSESLRGLLQVLPRDKIAAVIVNKIALGPPDLRAEFARFVEPLVRWCRTVSPSASFPLDRLAAWQTKLFHWAKCFGIWLGRTARSGRRQLP